MADGTSIRKRLLLLLLGMISLAWAAILQLATYDTRHEIEEIYDASLAQNARMLFAVLQQRATTEGADLIMGLDLVQSDQHEYELKLATRLRYGSSLFQSQGAPIFPKTAPVGFSEFSDNKSSEVWRLFTLKDDARGLSLMMAQSLEAREELVGDLLEKILLALFIGLPLFGLIIWWGVGRGLMPLRRLATEVEDLRPDSLHPIESRQVPFEVKGLVTALNRLLQRLGTALENERRFTSDASHELRTPLAALKIQAQVAQRATDEGQRNQALEKIVMGIDRATHLVRQLLELARADANSDYTHGESVADLHAVVLEVAGEMAGDAVARRIDLSLEVEGDDYRVMGDAGTIAVLLRNLLENAVRYSDEGGRVKIELQHSAHSVELIVEDDGPGISESERESMLQRFTRGESSAVAGSGLGLSIAKRICEIHNASIQLADAANSATGLRVVVGFALPAAPE
ncbi:MAG: ATP-binding protein [Sedimenticola sp.]